MTRKDIEVIAPVGSREALAAALAAGADAVYFGAGSLNMRAHSSATFGIADLPELAATAAENKARSYLTLNVTLFDDDQDDMRRIADAARAAGISALIVSDVAALEYARRIGMAVHLSTQANVANTEALRFYARWADTVVLARELNLDQVAVIAQAIQDQDIRGPAGQPVRLEVFAHGALCMAVSGKCYLSLHRYGTAANRGDCYQNCRRKYLLTDPEDGSQLLRDEDYFLSAKDLKTISFLDRILAAGVRSFKIEGRARAADYVQTTVACYTQAVSAVLDGTFTPKRVAEWDRRLAEVFNRGFWDGWYLGARMGEHSERYGSRATVKKTQIGVCRNYFAQAEAAEFLLEAGLIRRGDDLMISGPSSGVVRLTAAELRIDDQVVELAPQGSACTLPVPVKIRKGDKLFRLDTRTSPQA